MSTNCVIVTKASVGNMYIYVITGTNVSSKYLIVTKTSVGNKFVIVTRASESE